MKVKILHCDFVVSIEREVNEWIVCNSNKIIRSVSIAIDDGSPYACILYEDRECRC